MIWNCTSAFYQQSVRFQYRTDTKSREEFLIQILNDASIRAIVAAVSYMPEIINNPQPIRIIDNPFNALTIMVGDSAEHVIFFNPAKSE